MKFYMIQGNLLPVDIFEQLLSKAPHPGEMRNGFTDVREGNNIEATAVTYSTKDVLSVSDDGARHSFVTLPAVKQSQVIFSKDFVAVNGGKPVLELVQSLRGIDLLPIVIMPPGIRFIGEKMTEITHLGFVDEKNKVTRTGKALEMETTKRYRSIGGKYEGGALKVKADGATNYKNLEPDIVWGLIEEGMNSDEN